MTRFYLLGCLSCLSASVAAQGIQGYVITSSGDTLRGTVKEKSEGRVAYFAKSGAAQVFEAGQLRGYGVGRREATKSYPVRLADGTIAARFAVPLLQGPASLYTDAHERGLLLRMATADTLTDLTAGNWHVVFNRYLSGCAKMDQSDRQLLSLPYSTQNLTKVVDRYNRCVSPDWRPRKQSMSTPWQRYYGAYLGAFQIRYVPAKDDFTYHEASGHGFQAGGEWSWLRASGLQTSTQLSYANFFTESTPYLDFYNSRIQRRDKTNAGLVSAAATVSQRLGPARGLNFWAGAGVGVNAIVNRKTQVQERTAGSTEAFKNTSTNRDLGVGTSFVHAEAYAGVLLPLAQQELRLNAVYRRYIWVNTSFWGAQLAYYWQRK